MSPGNSVTDQVRAATSDAVREAQNSNASKKEVIQARDAAKVGVYESVAANISSSGAGHAQQINEIQNTPDHLQNIKNAGLTATYADAISRAMVDMLRSGTDQLAHKATAAYIAEYQEQNPVTATKAISASLRNNPLTSKAVDKIEDNKIIKKIIEEKDDDTYTQYTLDGLKLTKEEIPKNKNKDEKTVKSHGTVLNEAIAAGYYGTETDYTKKIDRNSNMVSDTFEGIATTLLDPSRLKKDHENPNLIADYIPDSVRPQADWAINLVDSFAKSPNKVARFVRGGTLDNLAGIAALGAEGTKTVSAVFLPKSGDSDLYKGVSYQPVHGIRIIETTIGRAIGGTVAAAKDDPIAFSGSMIIPFPIKLTGKTAKAKITGKATTLGKTSHPIELLQADKLSKLEGDVFREKMVYPDNYPTFDAAAKNINQPLSMFESTPNLYPDPKSLGGDSVMIHAHPNSWGDTHYGRLGKHGDPGTFGGPDLSTKFLRMPEIKVGGIGFSNPLKDVSTTLKNTKDVLTGKRDLYSPSVDFIVHEGFERLPDNVRGNKKLSRDWMIKEADPAKAYLTHKLESNTKAGKSAVEAEAAITPGAEFKLIENKFKTKVKQPITIFGKETIPGTGIKLQITVDAPVKAYRATGELKTVKRKRATGIVETDKGILLVEEKGGHLNLPGGGIDGFFETGAKAVSRELFEETGIKSKDTKKLFEYTDGTKKRSNQGGLYYNEHLVYEVGVNSDVRPKIKGNKEVVNVEYWKPGTDLPSKLNDASVEILKKRYPGSEKRIEITKPTETPKKTTRKRADESKNESKKNVKDSSDFDYAEIFERGESIPVVDLTYAIKPSKYSKTTKSANYKPPSPRGPSTPKYFGNAPKYLTKSSPYASKTSVAKTNAASSLLIPVRITEKKTKQENDVSRTRKKTEAKSDNVLKELRVNVIGDLII